MRITSRRGSAEVPREAVEANANAIGEALRQRRIEAQVGAAGLEPADFSWRVLDATDSDSWGRIELKTRNGPEKIYQMGPSAYWPTAFERDLQAGYFGVRGR